MKMSGQQIADAIRANCEAYHARQINHAAWHEEQVRLWDLATTERMRVIVLRGLGFLPSTYSPATHGCHEVEAAVAVALEVAS